jgi:two-component system response regulator
MSVTADRSRRSLLDHPAATGEVVLVVVDDDAFRALVTARLERAGADVHRAASVAEAIDVVESRHVDVVVCDYSMPKAPGTSLLAYLTRRGFPGRFVLTSAELPPEAAAEAWAQGAEAISKWDLLQRL